MTNQKPIFNPVKQWLTPAPIRSAQRLILSEGLETGLDVGCGIHSPLTPLRRFGFTSTGIDAWESMIDKARAADVHDHYICGDVMDHKFEQQFDVVVFSNVIEHIPRDQAMDVLRRLEQLASRMLIVICPNGFLEQPSLGSNPFQRHFSGWFPHDFQSRGFTVFGSGFRVFRGPAGRPRRLPGLLVRAVERAGQRWTAAHPRSSHSLTAIKFCDANGMIRQLLPGPSFRFWNYSDAEMASEGHG